jgi:hypothetical protein
MIMSFGCPVVLHLPAMGPGGCIHGFFLFGLKVPPDGGDEVLACAESPALASPEPLGVWTLA